MARLARPGGTLATFTSAGFVRRGLQEAVSACRSARVLAARRNADRRMRETPEIPARAPWFARSGTEQRDAAIIGGDRQRPARAGAAAPRMAGNVILRRQRAG